MRNVKLLGLLSSILLYGFQSVYAQGVTIGSNTSPDPSAGLDLQFQNLGFLMPRLTTAQRNGISNPAIGLQIFNLDTDCIETYFSSGGWKPVQCGCNAFPNAQFTQPVAFVNIPAVFQAPAPNMTYAWTFQNGNPGTANQQSPSVSWSATGKYQVQLTVTDSAGCTSTFVDSVNVSNCQPFTHTFTNCGATGRFGPSQTQCNNIYGSGVVTVNNGIQEWVVPASGTYRITVAGAEGGRGKTNSTSTYTSGVPGKGAVMVGDFVLTQGTVLKLVVGQKGSESIATPQKGGGGGGGSFVALQDNTALIVAGGGGGAGRYNGDNGSGGTTSTSGLAGNGTGGAGGTSGSGGGVHSCSYAGGSGAGFTGNGINKNTGHPLSFINGATGAAISDQWSDGNEGGFGGGGGTGPHGGGGGGGYSGGGGGGDINCGTNGGGGGGGSYNSGSNQSNTSDSNSGHGYITITRICQ